MNIVMKWFVFSKYLNNSAISLDQQERREEKLRERIQVLEEEKEELKEVERRGAKEKEEEEGGGRHEKDEKGKECVQDTERMLLAVLRELEGIPRCKNLRQLIISFSKKCSPLKVRFYSFDSPSNGCST